MNKKQPQTILGLITFLGIFQLKTFRKVLAPAIKLAKKLVKEVQQVNH